MAVSRVARASALAPIGPGNGNARLDPAAAVEKAALLARLATFHRLRLAATAPYEAGLHEVLLRALWRAAFGADPGYAACSPRWLELGFQGDDPAKDFRGAGAMSLHHLLSLMRSGHAPLPSSGFPLAVASINATAVLQSYFGVNLLVASPLRTTARHRCPEGALHDLLARGGFAPLQTLHTELVVHFGRLWDERSSPTVMDFPGIMDESCWDLHVVLEDLAAAARHHEGPAGSLCGATDIQLAETVGSALDARRWAARYGVSPHVVAACTQPASAAVASAGALWEGFWETVDCVPAHLCGGEVPPSPEAEERPGLERRGLAGVGWAVAE